jgi:Ca2+-binding EF-hand superfamily protein
VKNRWKFSSTFVAALGIGVIACVGIVAHSQKATPGQGSGKQWLSVMDRDHDGTVSKQEFNGYMDAQFDKADVDHDGTLDAKELDQLRRNLAIATMP